MFNIKVFPDFQAAPHDDQREVELLNRLMAVRQSADARYVNVSFFDHSGSGNDAVHFLTYPIDWISHYVTGFYGSIDPLLRVDFRTISLIDWRDLYCTREQMELLQRFADHGLGRNGLTLVEHVEAEVYCVLSASFDVCDDNWGKFKREVVEILRFQANAIGETYNRLFRLSGHIDYKITPREAECLYWVAMGKTDEQISTLLNIGKWTVNGHLQSAKYKLGTSSRSAAVARALVNGVISIRRAV
jgi:DNA-binding CsgD family transcriptional regulator